MKKFIIKLYYKLTRKTVVGAVSLAISLWIFTSLNETYTIKVDVPLILTLPADRSLENELPDHITVETVGNGWNLFGLIFMNNKKSCEVNLSETKIADSIYQLTRSQLITGVKSFEEVQSINVYPEIINIKSGLNSTVSVPLKDRITIKTKPQFVLVNNIQLEPDSIKITGNNKIVKNIKEWFTQKKVIENASGDIYDNISLSDSLSEIITIEPENVNYYANIQIVSELTFKEIPLEIIGGKLPKNYSIYPKYFDISVSGGIDEIVQLRRQEIVIAVELSDILNNSYGLIVPKVNLPDNISLKVLTPDVLHIIKNNPIDNLQQISRF